MTLDSKFHPRRREIAKISFVVLLVTIFSTALIFSLIGVKNNELANYVNAKCPGIPYGQDSGGPDYIDISIDAALVAVFGLFLYLTIRDMRRKAKYKAPTEL